MKLIVGLGNPGFIYRHCRHNIGFLAVKTLAKLYKIPLKKNRQTFSISGKGKIDGQDLILAMPVTFMNLSGVAVANLLKKYRIGLPRPFYKGKDTLGEKGRGLDNLLIICDDIDLEFGRLKIKPSGSSGGHRGLKSIIDAIRSQEFSRLRMGIGRPLKSIKAAEYVLSAFNRKEKTRLREILEAAGSCCRSWLRKDITETMNIFNASLPAGRQGA
jgi:PTH1 family peptidyl-tRNA hydrolase